MARKSTEGKESGASSLPIRLAELEKEAANRGIHIHYDRLEAAGLKLKDGICKVNGKYHIYLDKRKSPAEKVDLLEHYLNRPLPKQSSEVTA